MSKIFILMCVFLLLITSVSAYYCVDNRDSESVKEFKGKVNILSLKNDLFNDVSPEAIKLKLKYFGGCN